MAEEPVFDNYQNFSSLIKDLSVAAKSLLISTLIALLGFLDILPLKYIIGVFVGVLPFYVAFAIFSFLFALFDRNYIRLYNTHMQLLKNFPFSSYNSTINYGEITEITFQRNRIYVDMVIQAGTLMKKIVFYYSDYPVVKGKLISLGLGKKINDLILKK